MEMKSISEKLKPDSVPEDLVFEILLRLPVKSLLKLRCVSKSWCYLISTKRFVRSQLEFATNNPADYLRIAIRSSSTYEYHLNYFMNNLHCSEPAEFYFPRLGTASKLTYIIDTCNGLFCAFIDARLFVWNPSTRTHRELLYRDGSTVINCLRIGFCFHGGDYKVVASYREKGSDKIIAKLFSLRTDSWKRIGNTIPELSGAPTAGKFANGNVYWFDYKRKEDIVYFDLGSETYGIVEPPPDCEVLDLVVLQKCLCLISGDETDTDVWVLKHDSWIKMVSIDNECCPGIGRHAFAQPVWMTQEGEILISYPIVHHKDRFVIYDPRSNSVRRSNTEVVAGRIFQSNGYIQSLVSPFPDD